MMAERHPDDLDLLDLVEGDLPREVARAVSAHVEGCSDCTRAVQELRAGRAVLHASGRLELSAAARDRISAALDAEPRLRAHRFRYLSPRTLGIVVATTLVLVASALAIARIADVADEGDGGGVAAELAEEEAVEEEAAEGEAGDAAGEPAAPLAVEEARVAGPPREVARELRARGLDARVEDGEVVVALSSARSNADDEDAARRIFDEFLEERPPGPVVVRVEP